MPSDGLRPQTPHARSSFSPTADWNNEPQRPQ